MSQSLYLTWQRFATLDLHTEGEPLRILSVGHNAFSDMLKRFRITLEQANEAIKVYEE